MKKQFFAHQHCYFHKGTSHILNCITNHNLKNQKVDRADIEIIYRRNWSRIPRNGAGIFRRPPNEKRSRVRSSLRRGLVRNAFAGGPTPRVSAARLYARRTRVRVAVGRRVVAALQRVLPTGRGQRRRGVELEETFVLKTQEIFNILLKIHCYFLQRLLCCIEMKLNTQRLFYC